LLLLSTQRALLLPLAPCILAIYALYVLDYLDLLLPLLSSHVVCVSFEIEFTHHFFLSLDRYHFVEFVQASIEFLVGLMGFGGRSVCVLVETQEHRDHFFHSLVSDDFAIGADLFFAHGALLVALFHRIVVKALILHAEAIPASSMQTRLHKIWIFHDVRAYLTLKLIAQMSIAERRHWIKLFVFLLIIDITSLLFAHQIQDLPLGLQLP